MNPINRKKRRLSYKLRSVEEFAKELPYVQVQEPDWGDLFLGEGIGRIQVCNFTQTEVALFKHLCQALGLSERLTITLMMYVLIQVIKNGGEI